MNTIRTKTSVVAYLRAYAELDCFYITVGREIQGGLIGYVDRKGCAWTLMEDDEEMADACLEYLRSLSTPEFDCHEKEEAFISGIKQRIEAAGK